MNVNKHVEKKNGDGLLKTALTFSDGYDPESYDPATSAPASGDDFLQYVMYEASQCPAVVSAPLNRKNNTEGSPVNMPNVESASIETPPHLIATLEWQDYQVEIFAKQRKKIENNRFKPENVNNRKIFSRLRGRDPWVQYMTNNEPGLLDIMSLTQPTIIYVLEYILELLEELENGQPLPRFIGVWLYSILAALDKLQASDEYFTLRQIARRCIQLRASLPEDKHGEEFVAPFNLIICIVGRTFGQTDLADGFTP